MSRSTRTCRCPRGRSGRHCLTRDASLSATTRASTASDQGSGGWLHSPAAVNRPSSGSPDGTDRASRAPAVLARLARMWNSQVFTDERPSNRSIPRTTPSHVSCTTSSATARLGTIDSAKRNNRGWYLDTSDANAASSPARSDVQQHRVGVRHRLETVVSTQTRRPGWTLPAGSRGGGSAVELDELLDNCHRVARTVCPRSATSLRSRLGEHVVPKRQARCRSRARPSVSSRTNPRSWPVPMGASDLLRPSRRRPPKCCSRSSTTSTVRPTAHFRTAMSGSPTASRRAAASSVRRHATAEDPPEASPPESLGACNAPVPQAD